MTRTHAAVHVNTSTVFLHDAMTHPQPQPGSFFTLGGEEGIENAAPMFWANAMAVIGNGNADSPLPRMAPVAGLEYVHLDRPALRDSVQGITQEVG